MISITNKTDCCGCTACANICPKNCITMVPDEEGFLYPQVDVLECINCGLCEKVCPVINAPKNLHGEVESYVVRAKDDEVLSGSTSGGFFTPVAEYVLSENGVVCAATFDKDWNVVHEFITSREADISKYRGSKYVQSNLGSCFLRIKEYLVSNRLVLFVGTPCQVAGLKNYLQKEYENLITIDLVCRSIPSPVFFDKYREYQETKYASKIEYINFRAKTYGYHSGSLIIRFKNGKTYSGSNRVDYFMKAFHKNLISRPACYDCKFKTEKWCSDFTIFDCWYPEKVAKIFINDDDMGYTNVILHSEKAKNIIGNIISDLDVILADVSKMFLYTGGMQIQSIPKPAHRDEFMNHISEGRSFLKAVKHYVHIGFADYIVESSKNILYKLGLLKLIRKFR